MKKLGERMEKGKRIKHSKQQILVKKSLIIILLILLIINMILFILRCIKFIKNKINDEATETFSTLEENENIGKIDDINKNENNNKKDTEINNIITDWKLMLINKDNIIPDDYQVQIQEIEGIHKSDYRIVEQIKKMLYDARKQGLDPIICSSYRTKEFQETLFSNKVKYYLKLGYTQQKAEEEAAYWVTIPRTSEHEVGLAVDIVSKKYQILDKKQEETKVQKWLIEHCSDYGFVLRYPTEKKNITKINYEPWHYRYVGLEHAKIMKEKNFCLEEYIEYLKENKINLP